MSGWVKRGLIYVPPGDLWWSRTHAQVPTALVRPDCIRIFYATRDAGGRSHTSFIDVHREDPSHILYRHTEPLLPLGQIGAHDEDGVMVGCVVADGDQVLLYYTGWSRGGSVPYRVSVGLATSGDGGRTFVRAFEGPVVDRTRFEPHMTMSPYVVRERENLWRMWYGSGLRWVEIEGKVEPIYAIKYAQSEDGLSWSQPNVLCIEPTHDLEANTRPSVFADSTGYEMWFSYRHSRDFRDGTGAYRLGHARSEDGKKWRRLPDPTGLACAGEDWDGLMAAYPNVVTIGRRRLMLYNGNGFGRSGFGYASWEDDGEMEIAL